MQAYYLGPRPELVGNLIEAVHSTSFAQNNTAAPLMGFFSEIFAANPGRVPDWQLLVAKQDEQTKDVFDRALSLYKAGGVLTAEGHSVQLNDEYWGAFFASGNPKFVAKLIEQLRYFGERDDLQLFAAGATAKWSLASNAQLYPRVRETIEHERAGADKRTQELITELFVQGPEGVKRDMSEIIMRQRESAKWK